MVNLIHIKLASDLILAISIIYLCFRLARSRGGQVNNFEGRQLENSLRGLIAEASEASKGFNDQLLRRQKDLEKLLFDSSTSESRISRLVSTAEEQRAALELEGGRLDRKVQEAKSAANALVQTIESRQVQITPSKAATEQREVEQATPQYARDNTARTTRTEYIPAAPAAIAAQLEREITPERSPIAAMASQSAEISSEQEVSRHRARYMEGAIAPEAPHVREHAVKPQYSAKQLASSLASRAAEVAADQRANSSSFSVRQEASRAPKAPRVNIYGEPIIEEYSAAPEPLQHDYQPLSTRVERVAEPVAAAATKAYSKADTQAQIQKVYAAAEKLIRAGEDLTSVSSKTTLPIEELELLAQMVGREVALREEPNEIQRVDLTNMPKRLTTFEREDEDPRLGVLAGLKRQTQVL